ncbi:unannotated protein [freshwater metagenome]|uniref:Unannotated protein n=1 Tax=freshwater metagenome TaxID=449393 RepID=A0A6J7W1I6_9ZZZZ
MAKRFKNTPLFGRSVAKRSISESALTESRYFLNSASTSLPLANSAASALSAATTINVAPNNVSGRVV